MLVVLGKVRLCSTMCCQSLLLALEVVLEVYAGCGVASGYGRGRCCSSTSLGNTPHGINERTHVTTAHCKISMVVVTKEREFVDAWANTKHKHHVICLPASGGTATINFPTQVSPTIRPIRRDRGWCYVPCQSYSTCYDHVNMTANDKTIDRTQKNKTCWKLNLSAKFVANAFTMCNNYSASNNWSNVLYFCIVLAISQYLARITLCIWACLKALNRSFLSMYYIR